MRDTAGGSKFFGNFVKEVIVSLYLIMFVASEDSVHIHDSSDIGR